MHIDPDLLNRFEAHLIPQNPSASPIRATIIGYGEISSIFQIEDLTDIAFKRMPLFTDRQAAERYEAQYKEYCQLLREAGIRLPEDKTLIVEIPDHPVVLYIAQKRLPMEHFCHKLIHTLETPDIEDIFEQIVLLTRNVWHFNKTHRPSLELAIDGQLSNWAWLPGDHAPCMYFIDTSTPLLRKEGREQLDPELFLKSAPGFLRWLIRLFFLEGVMTRYYDPHLVFTDLVANLYKEQRPDLIPLAIDIVNHHMPEDQKPLSAKTVERYYKEDKLTWTLFLAFRRFDRFLKTKLLRKRYEFILPERIKR